VIGAISGDVIGSVHEGAPPRSKDFPPFVPGSRFTRWPKRTMVECRRRSRRKYSVVSMTRCALKSSPLPESMAYRLPKTPLTWRQTVVKFE
jgi:hypothetical protein